MATLNSGANGTTRFENGGVFEIGSDTVAMIVEGSITIREGGRARRGDRDRGAFTNVIREGDERMSRITLNVRMTDVTFDGSELYETIMAKPASGDTVTGYSLAVTFADDSGATTGRKVTFSNCFVDAPPTITTDGSGQPDQIQVEFMSLDHYGTWSDVA